VDKEKNNEEFSINEILAATGWKIETFNTYISKRWKTYITKSPTGKYSVKGIMKLALNDFLALQTQVKNISNIDINTQKLLDSFSEDHKELILDILNKVKDEDLSTEKIVEVKESIEGLGTSNTIFWEVPDVLKTGFQQYLIFFSDFVKRLTDEEIIFEISKVEKGLKLTLKSNSLPIDEIDNLFVKYVDYLVKANEDIIGNEEQNKLSQMQLFEYRQLIRDLQYERANLVRKVGDLYEREKLLLQNITDLRLIVSFFKNQSSHILQLGQQTDSHDINITYSPISINGNVNGSILGNINTDEFTQTKTSK
ncbi:MAG: hypothetical protein HC831_31135, partial [Chloroflexia bacterium]|nr:hypothetical protein [Chloroflexia bacterium]